MRFKDTELN